MDKMNMKQLIRQAKMVDCELFFGDTITLVVYSKKGRVKKKYSYDPKEPGYPAQIKNRLDKVAESLRTVWGPSFLELAPVAFPLGYTVCIDDYCATLFDPKKEEILLECKFNGRELYKMSDFIARSLLGDDLDVPAEQAKEAKKKKEEEEIMETLSMNKEMADVIAVMYYRMSPEERQGLKDTAGESVNRIIDTALKLSANR